MEQTRTLSSDDEQRIALRDMRVRATGLLLFMTFLYVLAKVGEKYMPNAFIFFEFLRAFSEAAMVGGIADWFAVTALFRYPLGIKIPHTAIIPRKKDSIGRGLGNFVQNNFLTPEALGEKLKSFDVEKKVADWLAVPANSRMVAMQISSFIPTLLNSLDDADVRRFIEKNIAVNVNGAQLANALGSLLSVLTANNRHHQLFNEILRLAEAIIHDEKNKQALKKGIKEESPWFVPDFVRNKVYEKIIDRIEETFAEVAKDPKHPLRQKFYEGVEKFIHDIQASPEFHKKIEELKNEILENPIVHKYLEQVWTDVKVQIMENVTAPDSVIINQIQKGVYSFFYGLINDETLRTKITNRLYEGVINALAENRNQIGEMISKTIEKWDEKTMSEKLELQVGKDLQYIRISGTLVGGLVGFTIHAFGKLISLF